MLFPLILVLTIFNDSICFLMNRIALCETGQLYIYYLNNIAIDIQLCNPVMSKLSFMTDNPYHV